MLTFKVSKFTSFTMADYDTRVIENLLLDLPKAGYSYIVTSPRYIITREAAQRIMKVTHISDHKNILEELVHFNLMSKEEQKERGGDDYIEITPSVTMPHGHIAISIHRMSDTDSVYLMLYHDSEQVMMDIQI